MLFVQFPLLKEHGITGSVPYQVYHNPMLPPLRPQKRLEVFGETVHHPGTSSGKAANKDEDRNENFSRLGRVDSVYSLLQRACMASRVYQSRKYL